MGGNALVESHGIKSERMDKKVYTELENYIVSILTKLDVNFKTVKYYHEKDDFGDLDIVVSRSKDSVLKSENSFMKIILNIQTNFVKIKTFQSLVHCLTVINIK